MPLIEHAERVQRAVEYLCEKRRERPKAALENLIDNACMRFDLSPLDTRQLIALFTQTETDHTSSR